MDPELWCVLIIGPDTVIAAESREEADARCADIQKTIEFVVARLPPDPKSYFPKMSAEVIPWPHSAESHARNCAEKDRWDGDLC